MTANRIEVIARGLVWSGDRLLLCRNVKEGYLYLPGGHVEPGESSIDALAREFMEETGLRVRVGKLAGVFELRFEQRGRERHELTLVFHVELSKPSLETVPSKEPKISFAWHDLSVLADLDVRPAQAKQWLMTPSASDPVHWRSDDERLAIH